MDYNPNGLNKGAHREANIIEFNAWRTMEPGTAYYDPPTNIPSTSRAVKYINYGTYK